MQWLAAKLIADGFDDFGIPMTDVEDAEAPQTIDVGPSGNVTIRVRSGVRPFDHRAGAMRIGRFAVLEKAGINVVAKRVDRLVRNPRSLLRSYVGLFD